MGEIRTNGYSFATLLRKRLGAKFAKTHGFKGLRRLPSDCILKVIFANERMYELFVINYCYTIRIEKNKNTQRYKQCKQNYHENLTIFSIN